MPSIPFFNPKKPRVDKGSFFIYVIAALAMYVGTSFAGGQVGITQSSGSVSGPVPVSIEPAVNNTQQTLHLETFNFTTPVPTAVPTTPPDQNSPGNATPTTAPGANSCNTPRAPCGGSSPGEGKRELHLQCIGPESQCDTANGGYYNPGNGAGFVLSNGETWYGGWCSYFDTDPGYDMHSCNADCTQICEAKPIIYLYPPHPTLVNISLDIPGHVIKSDPFYPETGWNNVLAQPNGSLSYLGKPYRELFYETQLQLKKIPPPQHGMIVPSNQIRTTLAITAHKLGLTRFETDELLAYWVPQLQKLHAPYLFFGVHTKEEKDAIDRVNISPKPDTEILLLMYFKPLQSASYENYSPLILPSTPPLRTGFTMVEWGGAIATD